MNPWTQGMLAGLAGGWCGCLVYFAAYELLVPWLSKRKRESQDFRIRGNDKRV